MCVMAVKYLDGYGFVGAKNRDRNFECSINILKMQDKKTERIYIEDNYSHWIEGVNQYGLCILSTAFAVNKDEDEYKNIRKEIKAKGSYNSSEAKTIKKALLLKSPKEALDLIIKERMVGGTAIFNEDEAYILESAIDEDGEYHSKFKSIGKDTSVVRTNHGLFLKWAGYQDSKDKEWQLKRDSSLVRYDIVDKAMKAVKTPEDLLNVISLEPNEDSFMNPVRKGDIDKQEMVTTGQLLLIPSQKTMNYRPLYSDVHLEDFESDDEAKTHFNVISNKNLLSFKEHLLLDSGPKLL